MSGREADTRERARRIYTSHRFRAAYCQGAKAARDGHAADTCPYSAAKGGWGAAYRLAWIGGWHSEGEEPNEVTT